MNLAGKRVLVTGGSGFIGSHLVHRLLLEGSDVAVMVRYGNVMRCERLRGCWDQLTIIEADLRNRGALQQAREFAPDVVYHLAAYNHVGESFVQVEECFDVNAKGTANLLDTLSGYAGKFVYLSTSEVYGHQTAVPFEESMRPEPISPYAVTKYAGEQYCSLYQRLDNSLPVVIVRGFNVFGPYQSSKAIIPELIVNCLQNKPIRTTKGEQTREFNFVSNLVDGIVAASQYDNPLPGVINIASGQETAIRDLVFKIAEITGGTSNIEIGALPYRPTEIWRMFADTTRARTLLDWEPKVGLAEGLRITVEWFREYLKHFPAPAGQMNAGADFAFAQ
ncbi:MAG TPA: GDP-mannose 4,6-dehydratase [Bryobacteraceae bacterium]|jgi:UDP-glucose 4-epimerase|nr:GDP-mannose 4,6-dehydratase [Bryobacteraceae bacterium]